MPIFRQNFIKNSSPATQIEITTYMAALGFDSTEKKGCYTNLLPPTALPERDNALARRGSGVFLGDGNENFISNISNCY